MRSSLAGVADRQPVHESINRRRLRMETERLARDGAVVYLNPRSKKKPTTTWSEKVLELPA